MELDLTAIKQISLTDHRLRTLSTHASQDTGAQELYPQLVWRELTNLSMVNHSSRIAFRHQPVTLQINRLRQVSIKTFALRDCTVRLEQRANKSLRLLMTGI